MATISPISIASSTGGNWLKEAQESLAASANPAGMLGALQNSRYDNGLKNFLAKSQNAAANLALMAQNSTQSSTELAINAASAAFQKRVAERLAAAEKLNAVPVNFTPPRQLDPVIYFANGSSLDTTTNILTRSDGKQIDATTGKEYVDESALIHMANGAYIDTKKNILVAADGTKYDMLTHLKITA
jgi:hypothetical protein